MLGYKKSPKVNCQYVFFKFAFKMFSGRFGKPRTGFSTKSPGKQDRKSVKFNKKEKKEQDKKRKKKKVGWKIECVF